MTAPLRAPRDRAPSPGERLCALVARLGALSVEKAAAVLLASVFVVTTSAIATARLRVDAGFSGLLPPSATSVRHLRALEQRTRVPATYMIGIEADTSAAREAATKDLERRAARLDPALVAGITVDQRTARAFVWSHRWLFATTRELEEARDELAARMDRAGPFDLGLDEEEPAKDRVAALSRRLDDARAQAQDDGAFVSDDGRLQLVFLRATFLAGDVDKGRALTTALRGQATDLMRDHPGVTVGLAGDVVTTVAEHDALLQGMRASVIATITLVLAALLVFYRSVLSVAALAWSLVTSVLATFALTWLTIGHLNIASAFLSSIVIGNGMNFGLVLLARHAEERAAGVALLPALQVAVRTTAPGTMAAAATATVAYGSLALTDFRGFRDFGIIGAVGMALCWVTAYTVLPAALAALGPRIAARPPLRFDRVLGAAVPARPRTLALVGLAVFAITTALTVRYLTHEPLEDDLRNLRSRNATLDEATRWMRKFDEAFGSGLDGGFAIGVERRADAPVVLAKLRAVDEGRPEAQRWFSSIHALDDVVPADQERKLALCAEIRRMLDARILTRLDAEDRRRLAEARPPDGLSAIRDEDVPDDVAWPFVERDGRRGRLILANTGPAVDGWRVSSLETFAAKVRSLDLGPDVVIGGSAFVFSDMLVAMHRDGGRATLAAVLGSGLVILVLLGPSRHAAITLACAALGTTALLSAASVLGIKVNFLDFVALPITIGIGVDYSVNIAARARTIGGSSPGRRALLATGPVVALCSYTTVVGYGSLLFSQNRGIHTFGLAAILGELTCLVAALLLAPALLDWRREP